MEKEIYFAGGCFWGLEEYLSRLVGVVHTEVGYANGTPSQVSYEQVCTGLTGHAEIVRTRYDKKRIGLERLIELYFQAIDPFSVNRQGADIGSQYRTGIYYTDKNDQAVIDRAIAGAQKKYERPIAVECAPLSCFCRAEEYHQKYLQKNPGGYCHIDIDRLLAQQEVKIDSQRYPKPPEPHLRDKLTDMQYNVTQQGVTEPPCSGDYDDFYDDGIYVDIVTGEPLFTSREKFFSGCGWPSFSAPVAPEVLTSLRDTSHGMERTEVRSRAGNSHLGHVFADGPREAGGMRYCINSAALRFVPYAQMDREGYGELKKLIR